MLPHCFCDQNTRDPMRLSSFLVKLLLRSASTFCRCKATVNDQITIQSLIHSFSLHGDKIYLRMLRKFPQPRQSHTDTARTNIVINIFIFALVDDTHECTVYRLGCKIRPMFFFFFFFCILFFYIGIISSCYPKNALQKILQQRKKKR